MKRLFNLVILPLICVAAGIFLIIMNIQSLKTGKNFEKTTATITDIRESYDAAREEYDHEVIVEYTYKGETYQSPLGEYSSSYKVGKELEIKVNPADPSEARPASDTGIIIGILFGFIAIIAGGVICFKGLTRR